LKKSDKTQSRRDFLAGAGSVAGLSVLSSTAPLAAFQAAKPAAAPAASGVRPALKITAVEVWEVSGKEPREDGLNGQPALVPIDVYPENRPAPYKDSPNPKTTIAPSTRLYLKIVSDQGTEGFYGPISEEAAGVINTQLRSFVLGQDALAIDTINDKMFRRSNDVLGAMYGAGVSAIDNTLWDLRGKHLGLPVYRLLGGSRKTVDVYCSTLGFSLELDKVKTRALELKKQGFNRQKWFPGYGPSSGAWGYKQNVELARILRETLGDEADIMIDPHRGWDLPYTLRYLKDVEPYKLRWIEEMFTPPDIEQFAQVRRQTGVPVATGESLYGRYEVRNYIAAGAVDVIQIEPDRCGGLSELVKVAALASVHDLILIPHGGGIRPGVHLVASRPPSTCPFAEFLMLSRIRAMYYEQNPMIPVNGQITIPDLPGLGIELDRSKVEGLKKIAG
jgi:L-alanine-DL-glutamate epimerase-like enolase superfamily enzyme